MHDKLIANIETRRSGVPIVKFSGVLDEHNHLNQIAERFTRGSVIVLNVEGIERINSTGVRDWVDWLALLDVMGVKPVLVACSPAFVAQMNRIKNFAGNAVVKSFYAPYHCMTCRSERNVLLEVVDMLDVPKQAPAASCETCGNAMRFTDEAAVYFEFVQDLRQSGRYAHDAVEAALARGSESELTVDRGVEVAVIESAAPPVRPSVRPSMAMRVLRARPAIAVPPALDDRPWLLAVIAVLLCTVAVLLVVELT